MELLGRAFLRYSDAPPTSGLSDMCPSSSRARLLEISRCLAPCRISPTPVRCLTLPRLLRLQPWFPSSPYMPLPLPRALILLYYSSTLLLFLLLLPFLRLLHPTLLEDILVLKDQSWGTSHLTPSSPPKRPAPGPCCSTVLEPGCAPGSPPLVTS